MTLRFLFLIFAFGIVGCGNPTDKPTDCNTNEYFDESDELCKTCPPLAEPDCALGCGFTIESDPDVDTLDRCPIAVCNLTCESPCPDGEYYSEERLGCVACPTSPNALGACL